METIYRYIVLCSLILVQGCKDENIPDCGCNSRTKYTVPSPLFSEVPDEEQTNGFIIYKDQMTEDDRLKDSQFDNRFWILRNNYLHKFIVCNEGELTSEFDFLKESQIRDTVAIKFTGNTKYMCTEPFIGHADFEYAEIQLTSIEKIIN
jgi:hypothetical protein